MPSTPDGRQDPLLVALRLPPLLTAPLLVIKGQRKVVKEDGVESAEPCERFLPVACRCVGE